MNKKKEEEKEKKKKGSGESTGEKEGGPGARGSIEEETGRKAS